MASSSSARPEHLAPPEIFYDSTEAAKYTSNTRITYIQQQMTERAVELLNLPADTPCYLLDIGCGSGLSGECLDEDGHVWVGMDISEAMLEVAKEREVEGDLFLQDIGDGLAFRPGTFDGAISISVIQWLCNADKSTHTPQRRLARFFSTLYTALVRGARAVFQFYPENERQVEMILAAALKAGFSGGLVVDYPNSAKAKKFYLCLIAGSSAGGANAQQLPKGREGDEADEATVDYAKKRMREPKRRGKKGAKPAKHSKEWIMHKKELNRMRGKAKVPMDSKYTARKRRIKF